MAKVKAGKRGGKGCFFWGTLTIGGIILVSVLGIMLAGYLQIRQFVMALDDEPATMQQVGLLPELVNRANNKYTRLRQAIETGEEVSVTLTDQELNALVASHPDFAKLKGHVFFTFKDRSIVANVSYPADPLNPQFLGLFDVTGKYFNGTFTVQPSVEQGRFRFKVLAATMKDAPVSDANLRVLQQNDLRQAMEWSLDATQKQQLQQLEAAFDEVVMRDGKLLIRTNAPPPETPDVSPDESMDEAPEAASEE